jgi:hypothetical protein
VLGAGRAPLLAGIRCWQAEQLQATSLLPLPRPLPPLLQLQLRLSLCALPPPPPPARDTLSLTALTRSTGKGCKEHAQGVGKDEGQSERDLITSDLMPCS